MAAAKVTVTGMDDIRRRLEMLTPKLQKRWLKRVLRKAAQPMLKEAKALAPRDTGLMAKTLGIRTYQARGDAIARVTTAKRSRLNIPEDYEWYYPTAVEYGHEGPRPAPPHPFLRPAFEHKVGEAVRIFQDLMSQAVEAELKTK